MHGGTLGEGRDPAYHVRTWTYTCGWAMDLGAGLKMFGGLLSAYKYVTGPLWLGFLYECARYGYLSAGPTLRVRPYMATLGGASRRAFPALCVLIGSFRGAFLSVPVPYLCKESKGLLAGGSGYPGSMRLSRTRRTGPGHTTRYVMVPSPIPPARQAARQAARGTPLTR